MPFPTTTVFQLHGTLRRFNGHGLHLITEVVFRCKPWQQSGDGLGRIPGAQSGYFLWGELWPMALSILTLPPLALKTLRTPGTSLAALQSAFYRHLGWPNAMNLTAAMELKLCAPMWQTGRPQSQLPKNAQIFPATWSLGSWVFKHFLAQPLGNLCKFQCLPCRQLILLLVDPLRLGAPICTRKPLQFEVHFQQNSSRLYHFLAMQSHSIRTCAPTTRSLLADQVQLPLIDFQAVSKTTTEPTQCLQPSKRDGSAGSLVGVALQGSVYPGSPPKIPHVTM